MVMNIFTKKNLEKKLGIFHWNIGFIENTFADILNHSASHPVIHWLKHSYHDRFFADPFLLEVSEDKIEVLVEEFLYSKWKGTITQLTVSRKDYRLIKRKNLLESDTHLSFPYIYKENNETYVIPENSQSGTLLIYRYDKATQTMEYIRELIHAPIVDPVIFKSGTTYYLICTSLEFDEDKALLLYHSDNLFGPYQPFTQNPVKLDITSARPGGGVHTVNDKLYRCAQNSENSYGASLAICHIRSIGKNIFQEETALRMLPDSVYKHGLHTLDYKEGICVVDGLNYLFKPVLKMKRKLKAFK